LSGEAPILGSTAVEQRAEDAGKERLVGRAGGAKGGQMQKRVVIGGQEPQGQGENETYRSEDAVCKKLAS